MQVASGSWQASFLSKDDNTNSNVLQSLNKAVKLWLHVYVKYIYTLYYIAEVDYGLWGGGSIINCSTCPISVKLLDLFHTPLAADAYNKYFPTVYLLISQVCPIIYDIMFSLRKPSVGVIAVKMTFCTFLKAIFLTPRQAAAVPFSTSAPTLHIPISIRKGSL